MLWTLEAVNAVLMPAVVGGLVLTGGGSLGPAFASGALLCAGLLVLGALYWRAKLAQLRRRAPVLPHRRTFARAKPVAALAVVVTGQGCALAPLLGETLAGGVAGGAVLWALGALEYVNYFHRQLMHDTRADLRRLWATRRLRRSFLALDLER